MKRTYTIALATGRDGKDWSAQGWGTERSGDVSIPDAMASCVDCVDAADIVQFTVTVEVDIPEPVPVTGTATREDSPTR